jgi:hypothetical protein
VGSRALAAARGNTCIDALAQPPEDPVRQDSMRQRAALEQERAFANEALFQAAASSRDATARLPCALRIAGADIQSQ